MALGHELISYQSDQMKNELKKFNISFSGRGAT